MKSLGSQSQNSHQLHQQAVAWKRHPTGWYVFRISHEEEIQDSSWKRGV